VAHLGSNRVFWTPDGESCDLASGKKSKKLVEIVEPTFLAVFGRFCMGVLWRGSDFKKCRSLVHDSGFWPAARHAIATFSISTNSWLLITEDFVWTYFPIKCMQAVAYFARIRQVC
jgi:hypothetical protein